MDVVRNNLFQQFIISLYCDPDQTYPEQQRHQTTDHSIPFDVTFSTTSSTPHRSISTAVLMLVIKALVLSFPLPFK